MSFPAGRGGGGRTAHFIRGFGKPRAYADGGNAHGKLRNN